MFAMLKSIDLYSFQNDSLKKHQWTNLLSYAPPSFVTFGSLQTETRGM